MKLVISTEIELEEPTVDHGFITWLTMQISADTELDPDATIPIDPTPVIGRCAIAIVHVGKVAELGGELLDVLDADSAALETLYHVYFEDGGLREQFAAGVGHDLLYVSELVVDHDWQGRNIELAVVKRLCDTLGQGCEMAIVPYGSPEESSAWEEMGFEVSTPGEQTGFMHLSLAYSHPRIVDTDIAGRFKVLPSSSPKEHEGRH